MKETKFKQTDIGLIPEDWVVKCVGDYADILNGDRSERYPKDDELVKRGVPFINAGHIVNGKIDFSNMDYISSEKYNAMSGVKFKKNDILICLRGSLGKNAVVNFDEGTVASSLCVVRTKEIKSSFLVSLLNSNLFENFIKEENNGSSQPNLSALSLRHFQHPIPPMVEEQERIANALSQVDDLLAALDEQIEKKKLIKQGTMQQLLTGKTRLKGFSGKWMTVKLGDVADIRTGKRNGDENIESGLYPFFVRSQSVYRINSYSYDGEAILIPGEGGIGKIFHYINGKFDYHQRVYKISDFPSNFDTKFVYFYLMKFFGSHALQNTVKATVDSLRLPTFQDFMLVVPPTLAEQQTIASILSTMDEEIQALQEERDKYALVKQGMMQQLLTGKIRLN